MEVGGYDLLISTSTPKTVMQDILDLLSWEEAIFESDGENGLFVYPDLESKTKWDEDSLEEVVVGSGNQHFNYREAPMIYFIFGEDYLSVTSDKLFIDKIKVAIKN